MGIDHTDHLAELWKLSTVPVSCGGKAAARQFGATDDPWNVAVACDRECLQTYGRF